ncbi:hypothetical protein [Mesorhizobium dulcispinae]|uniref:hypothetical protein n=1 Tax=Mesorhizobium dulcispinae TaxID=3072316 RepID=UPI002A242385|nr:hypothetical protein [Mesorhizobium sp. VK23D]MDX8518727.1 hypothetical protein [Mesorhizobium sp. VK23D]
MPADVDALNYPYIRVRSVDWLKRTLLVFPHVVRITPDWGGPLDDPEIRRFSELIGRRGPLLRRAHLNSANVYKAQLDLIRKIRQRLEEDADSFIDRFGRRATEAPALVQNSVWDDRAKGEAFQLHPSKIILELSEMLRAENLAWMPTNPHSHGYVEMSPELGRAVMATLAFACAEDEGLTLVTEFPEIFGRLIHQPKESIFDACLSGGQEALKSGANDLAELIVYQRCDVTKLTPERIQALNKEWDALAAFKSALEDAAQSLPQLMLDKTRREERLRDLAASILQKWKNDRANLSTYARSIFGGDFLDQPEKLIEKVADTAFVGVSAMSLAGAAVGSAIGIAFHAAKSVVKVRKVERESPFRYLTLLEKNGVGFVVTK